jgi:hypothetical protein
MNGKRFTNLTVFSSYSERGGKYLLREIQKQKIIGMNLKLNLLPPDLEVLTHCIEGIYKGQGTYSLF